jgi:ribosomal protein L40E
VIFAPSGGVVYVQDMDVVCHRCSATVEPDAFYCQNCGAPLIRFVAPEAEAVLPSVNAEGKLPGTVDPDHSAAIQWKPIVRIAALVAVCVGVLSTLLAAGSVLWVAVGSVLAIGMYHRRQPHALLGRRVGARIGALLGLLAAAVALAGNAVFLVVQRYGMHQGTLIDTQLMDVVKQAAGRAAAMDPQAPITTFTNFWLSPEGRIGLILLTMGFLALLIVLFAIAGGVLGAQIYRSPRQRKALP